MTNRYQREKQKQRKKEEQYKNQINNFTNKNFNGFLIEMFNLCIKDLLNIAKETSNPEEKQLILTLISAGTKLIQMKINERKEVD